MGNRYLVIAEYNRFGHLEVEPVSDRVRRYLKRASEPYGDGTLYLQTDTDIAAFLDNVAPSVRRDLEGGWPVRCKIDAWTFGVWCGVPS